MICKKISWVVLICLVPTMGIVYQISKAEIIMDKAPPDFAIVDYKVVNYNISGNILNLGFQLFSKNRGTQPIYNVKVSLAKVPKNVSIHRGEVLYPTIFPQEAVNSLDIIEIQIKNYQQIDTLPFTWKIEYDCGKGERQKGEIVTNYKKHFFYR